VEGASAPLHSATPLRDCVDWQPIGFVATPLQLAGGGQVTCGGPVVEGREREGDGRRRKEKEREREREREREEEGGRRGEE
jgi:hypothetical protein